jgi:hypothetical protein
MCKRKLTPEQVIEIREHYRNGGLDTYIMFSKKFSVTAGAIYLAAVGNTYKRVCSPPMEKRLWKKDLPKKERRKFCHEDFWSYVDRSGGENSCWNWTKSTATKLHYGHLRYNGGYEFSHRVAFILTHGEIPDGMHVCHSCDNPLCCNPAHLWLGTPLDNMRDREAKGRGRAGRNTVNIMELYNRNIKPKEISSTLNIKLGTVYATIERHRDKLKI